LGITNRENSVNLWKLIVVDELQFDVAEVDVWNIANKDPAYFEYTFPFVRCPYGTTPSVVNLKINMIMILFIIRDEALTGVNISAIPQK
jgi:hypothetical protein